LKFARCFPSGVIPSRARDLLFNKIKQLRKADSSFLGMTPPFQQTVSRDRLVKQDQLSAGDRDAALEHVTTTTDYAVRGAELIIEAAPSTAP